MNQNTDQIFQDYLSLREQVGSVQLATLDVDANPEASYAPCTWRGADCFVFLSQLASHTQNLQRNPSVGLMLIEAQTEAGNAFARKRVSLFGEAEVVTRTDDLYPTVISDFYHRFGEVMNLIEPLQDFHLFRITVRRGRFIRGFGQAYELAGDKLDRLVHIDPRQ